MFIINGIAAYSHYGTGLLKVASNAPVFVSSRGFIDFENFDAAGVTDERGNFMLEVSLSDTYFLYGYYDEGFLIYQGGIIIRVGEKTDFNLILSFPRQVIF